MKTIKKVSVTSLPETSGSIIDSFNTGDDKHTNAPSLNIVENKFAEIDSKIVTLSTTFVLSGAGYTTLDYPTGFNRDNCTVIGFTYNKQYDPQTLAFSVYLNEQNITIAGNSGEALITIRAILTLMRIS